MTLRVPPAAVAPSQTRIVKGQISATEERAKADVRNALRDDVVDWLGSEVPGSWTPPSRLIDALILETQINPVVMTTAPFMWRSSRWISRQIAGKPWFKFSTASRSGNG